MNQGKRAEIEYLYQEVTITIYIMVTASLDIGFNLCIIVFFNESLSIKLISLSAFSSLFILGTLFVKSEYQTSTNKYNGN